MKILTHQNTVIKVVIIEDEIAAQNILIQLINASVHGSRISIEGIAATLEKGAELIKKVNPNVVFVDINLPTYSGIKILNFIDKVTFKLVFVTAYEKYAIEAFELNAMDYILKPIHRKRFEKTLDKIVHNIDNETDIEKLSEILSSFQKKSQKLIIKDLSGTKAIPYEQIVALKAQGSYCFIYLSDGDSFLASRNLKFFVEQFKSPHSFFRSHKTWFINMDHIIKIDATKRDLFLKGNLKAIYSKGRFKQLELLMKNI